MVNSIPGTHGVPPAVKTTFDGFDPGKHHHPFLHNQSVLGFDFHIKLLYVDHAHDAPKYHVQKVNQC